MKKLGVMLALMLCLTIVVPMAIAASTKCPVSADGNHHFKKGLDYIVYRYELIPGNQTYHKEYLAKYQNCVCGAQEMTSDKKEQTVQHKHTHETERRYTGAKRIDAQYHYRVYDSRRGCECGHLAWFYSLVDTSVKQSHSFTNVVSSTTKNGKRIVVKKCACGEKKTFTYTVPPTQ